MYHLDPFYNWSVQRQAHSRFCHYPYDPPSESSPLCPLNNYSEAIQQFITPHLPCLRHHMWFCKFYWSRPTVPVCELSLAAFAHMDSQLRKPTWPTRPDSLALQLFVKVIFQFSVYIVPNQKSTECTEYNRNCTAGWETGLPDVELGSVCPFAVLLTPTNSRASKNRKPKYLQRKCCGLHYDPLNGWHLSLNCFWECRYLEIGSFQRLDLQVSF